MSVSSIQGRPRRLLVLHADDFGLNAAVTQGIVDGFSEGLLTSTSLLTNAPAAELAIDEWLRLEEVRRSGGLRFVERRGRVQDADAPFDLGAHLNLTQGRPLTGQRFPSNLLDREGRFLPPGKLFLQLLVGGHRWQPALDKELSAQIEWLLDHGLRPTHLNGHQYVEMMPVVSELVPALARRYGVPYVRAACEPGHSRTSLRPGMRLANWCLSIVKQHFATRCRRALDAAGVDHSDAYFGASHAGRIDLNLLQRYLRLAQDYARSEIAFHPGRLSVEGDGGSSDWHDPLAADRPAELRLLCSPSLAELLSSTGFILTRLARPVPRTSSTLIDSFAVAAPELGQSLISYTMASRRRPRSGQGV